MYGCDVSVGLIQHPVALLELTNVGWNSYTGYTAGPFVDGEILNSGQHMYIYIYTYISIMYMYILVEHPFPNDLFPSRTRFPQKFGQALRPRGLEEAAAGEAEADARLCSQGGCSGGSAEAAVGEQNMRKYGGIRAWVRGSVVRLYQILLFSSM